MGGVLDIVVSLSARAFEKAIHRSWDISTSRVIYGHGTLCCQLSKFCNSKTERVWVVCLILLCHSRRELSNKLYIDHGTYPRQELSTVMALCCHHSKFCNSQTERVWVV